MTNEGVKSKAGRNYHMDVPAPCTTSAERKALAAKWMANQKQYARESFKGISGRFPTQAELLKFISKELAKGGRTQSAIAKDAGISPKSLYYLRDKISARLPNDGDSVASPHT